MTTSKAPSPPNHEALPTLRRDPNAAWRCRVCGYSPNIDKRSKFCISCGRDYWGNPGKIPGDVGDPRPQVFRVGYAEE